MGHLISGRDNRRRNNLLTELNEVVSKLYPTLVIGQYKPRIIIRGWFPVRLEGVTLDRYYIEIEFPNDYPKSVPFVREIGNRIPKELDRHIYVEGTLCLFLPDEQWRYWGEGKEVRAFLEETVNDFFLGQLYFEKHLVFPFGERRHGIEGTLDYYSEELGTNDPAVIGWCIRYLCYKRPKGHWKCYCGSGKKLRHCHINKMMELHGKIPQKTAKQTRFRLQLAAMKFRNEDIKRQNFTLRSRWQLTLKALQLGKI